MSRVILASIRSDEIYTKIRQIINACLRGEVFPGQWKRGKVVMILKPDKTPRTAASYRPIALLDVIGKVYEMIIKDRLEEHVEQLNLVPYSQKGFRPARSTQTAHLELQTEATKTINSGFYMLALYLDLEAAFDRVWHDALGQVRSPCVASSHRR